MIRRGLGTGLPENVLDRVVSEFTPESVGLYTDKCGSHVWDGPRGFVLTTDDEELPPGLQRRFAERLGGQWAVELRAGHLPMLQDPVATATAVDGFLNA